MTTLRIGKSKSQQEIDQQLTRLRDPNNLLGVRLAAYDYLMIVSLALTDSEKLSRDVYLAALKRELKRVGSAAFGGTRWTFVDGNISRTMGG